MEFIRIISNDQFEKYRVDWSNLLEIKLNTNPFIEFDWVNEWWKHLAGEQRVEIIAVQKEGKFIAFFPFVVKKSLFGYTYNFMAFGKANYMDFIANDDLLEASIEFVIDEIIRTRKNVVFNLHGLLESGNTPEALEKYLQNRELSFSVHRVITPFINLDTINLEAYMKKRRKLHRLDRREKRLNENGEVKVQRSGPKEMDYIFKLHDKRWKKKQDTSGFTNLKEKAFYRSLSKIQEGPMQTEIDALYINDAMIAFNYGFYCRGRYLGYILGYDDDFEVFGPGRILEKGKIAQCKNRDDSNFDLSIGYEPYKFEWNTHLDYTRKVIFSSQTNSAKIRRGLLTGKENLVERIKGNYKVVLFKRNTIGKLIFNFKSLNRKELGEEKSKYAAATNWVKNYLYGTECYVIYKIEKKDMKELPVLGDFIELTIKDVMQNDEIAKEHIKGICKKIYGGYKGYYPKGRLSYNHIFWTNEKVLRIDCLDYLEQFGKSSIFIENWNEDNLLDVCSSIKKDSNARTIYVAVEDRLKNKKGKLEGLGFSAVKRISKRTYFGVGKNYITE